MERRITKIVSLFGVRSRRKSSSSPPNEESKKSSSLSSSPSPPPQRVAAGAVETEDTANNKEPPLNEVPVPKAMHRKTNSCSEELIKKKSPEKKLKSSLSVKVARSLSMAINRDHQKEGDYGRRKGKLNPEECVWTKTIILGEKCKVPDEEDDAVLHDGKGKRIPAYHPRTRSSISISSQNSFLVTDPVANEEEK